MKISSFLISASLLLSSAMADEVWAPGVSSENRGWYDYDKAAINDGVWADTAMCWAATASNVIAWWQDHNKDSLTSITVPSENPWVVSRYLFDNVGGYPSAMYDWWINGITWGEDLPDLFDTTIYDSKEETIYGIKKGDIFEGGFLKDVYDTTLSSISINGSTSDNAYTKAAAIVNALADGYALSITVNGIDNKSISHAFTLWGVEYTETDAGIELTKAYITDSDDGAYGLVTAQVAIKNNVLTLHSMDTWPSYAFGITGAYGMRLLPEPTSTTLSILALAGLAVRRRRR